jgi:hypothetical protein
VDRLPNQARTVPLVTRTFAEVEGSIVAVTDWMKWPPTRSPAGCRSRAPVLGTDKFGRSSARPALRRDFKIDACEYRPDAFTLPNVRPEWFYSTVSEASRWAPEWETQLDSAWLRTRGVPMVEQQATEEALALVVTPASDDYAPTDPRWRNEVGALMRAVEQQVPVEQKLTPVEGTKLGVVELIAVLGSAGAITAAVQVFQAWLKRDKSRHLVLSWHVRGEQGRIELDAEHASEEGTREVLTAALEELTGRGR